MKKAQANNPRLKQGFTLIEIMIAVAIIGLLAAIAIPQYHRFLAKTKRTEASLILNGIHKSQTAYFALNDHFLDVCEGTSPCTPYYETQYIVREGYLGLDSYSASSSFYQTSWTFNANNTEYLLYLTGDILNGNGWDDMLVIGRSAAALAACAAKGYSDNVPYLSMDDINARFICLL